MKIESVRANNNRRVFEVATRDQSYDLPYAKTDAIPTPDDPIVELFIDDELGREGFTYRLASGLEDAVLWDQVLDYNADPAYMRDLLLYRLSVEAQERLKESPLSKREVIRRLGTSPSQFYRLLDQTNYTKSIDKMLELLAVLDCEVDFVVKPRAS